MHIHTIPHKPNICKCLLCDTILRQIVRELSPCAHRIIYSPPYKTLADWHYHTSYLAEALSHIITGSHFPRWGNRCRGRGRIVQAHCLLGLRAFSWLWEACIDRDRGGKPAPINHCERVNATALHSAKEQEAIRLQVPFSFCFCCFKAWPLLLPTHTLSTPVFSSPSISL